MHTDTEAIATWQRNDQADESGGVGPAYICCTCVWTGRGGSEATAHHTATGHDVRGRDWPASWGNAVFTDRVDPWLVKDGTR